MWYIIKITGHLTQNEYKNKKGALDNADKVCMCQKGYRFLFVIYLFSRVMYVLHF